MNPQQRRQKEAAEPRLGYTIEEIDRLRASLSETRQELQRLQKAAKRAADCKDCTALIVQRDAVQEAADALVNVIERFLGVDCGEHSNLNNPWEEALAFMEGEIARRDAGAKA